MLNKINTGRHRKAIKFVACNQQPTEADYNRWAETVSQASSLVKLIDGVVNNAAWAACLDAYECIEPLKRFNQQVKGGDTAGYGYQRCFKALKEYQRNLIYASENRFFHVADMTEETRSFYAKDMTDEQYYDFWASFGFKAYQDNRPFLTCLVNKLYLVYKKGNVKHAEAAAWSMGAFMSLNVATECHADAIKAVARQWGGQAIRMAKPLPRFRPHSRGEALGQRTQGLLSGACDLGV